MMHDAPTVNELTPPKNFVYNVYVQKAKFVQKVLYGIFEDIQNLAYKTLKTNKLCNGPTILVDIHNLDNITQMAYIIWPIFPS